MSVMLAAAVAERSGVDAATSSRVIAALSSLLRDMALEGNCGKLDGLGRFVLVKGRDDAGAFERLGFEPVGKLRRLPSRK